TRARWRRWAASSASRVSGSARSSRRRCRSSATPAGRRSSATTSSSRLDPDLLDFHLGVVPVAQPAPHARADLRHRALDRAHAPSAGLAGDLLALLGDPLDLRALRDLSEPPADLLVALATGLRAEHVAGGKPGDQPYPEPHARLPSFLGSCPGGRARKPGRPGVGW